MLQKVNIDKVLFAEIDKKTIELMGWSLSTTGTHFIQLDHRSKQNPIFNIKEINNIMSVKISSMIHCVRFLKI